MIGYRFLPPAEEEMIGESLFYQTVSPELAQDFLDDVQRVVDLLRERPGLGQPVGRGLRRTVLRRFPFSLIYAEGPEAIVIVAIAHHKRRPGYWRQRIAR